jgi:hypothetical protein
VWVFGEEEIAEEKSNLRGARYATRHKVPFILQRQNSNDVKGPNQEL